jgi:polyphenol oxidase
MRGTGMEPFVLEKKEFLILKDWIDRNHGLTAGFTTRNHSSSDSPFNLGFHVAENPQDVCANKEKLSELLTFPLSCWVGAEQTHEIFIKKVTKEDKGKGSVKYEDSLKRTDGLYTFEKDILLTLCFADCVPIYFLEPKSGMIGIIHAGWKGSVNGIAEEMVLRLADEGIRPDELLVAIGPSICEKCYIVDEHVMKLVQNRLEAVEKKPYNLIKDGQYSLNLQELNKLILMKNGVLEEHIAVTQLCTSCHSDLFFSHRRDKGKTGRMMGFIGWKEGL